MDPQRVIFLDEPTTGLDPVTKRAVWRTIEEAKQGKTIILTTHSMEEADALAQRIGIMVAGQLRCIGTREHLKTRFGSGFRLQVIHKTALSTDLDRLVFCAAPESRLHRREPLPTDPEQTRSFFIIPPGNPISYLYDAMSREKNREGSFVLEFGVSFTSLEEVFLTVAGMVEPLPKGINFT